MSKWSKGNGRCCRPPPTSMTIQRTKLFYLDFYLSRLEGLLHLSFEFCTEKMIRWSFLPKRLSFYCAPHVKLSKANVSAQTNKLDQLLSNAFESPFIMCYIVLKSAAAFLVSVTNIKVWYYSYICKSINPSWRIQLRESFLIIDFPPGMTFYNFWKFVPSLQEIIKVVLLTKFSFCALPVDQ